MLRREVEGNKIKSRASHIPGGGALLRGGWGRSRGWQSRAPKDPGTQGSRGAREPARTSGHHGRLAGREPGLAATWEHLGLGPCRTSGVAGRRGWGALAGGGGDSIRRRGRRRGSPAPREQRSAGRAGPITEALVAMATAASGAAAPRRPRCKVTQQAESARNLEIRC